MKRNISTSTTLIAAIAAAAALAACNRPEDGRTTGQREDGAVTTAQRKAEELKTDIGKVAEKAKQETGQAMEAVADKAKDAAITTSVNAELAKDTQLSALKIDVDTAGGKVALHGSAPDAASRDRATRLAMNVDGVRSVDNQLIVRQ